MDVFLVRHGEAATDWGESADPGLSALGKQQAEQAARDLVPQLSQDVQIISSPLARAQETAQPLARLLGSEIALSDVFREVPAPVPLEQRQDWLSRFMAQQWSQQDKALQQWRSAILDALRELHQPVVIFTHFLVINGVAGHVLDRDETLCFFPANGSVTQLHHTGDDLQLVALGDQMQSIVN